MIAALAARLVLVYAGSAALVLYLAHRFVRPLARGAALCLVLLPVVFVGKALVTAGVYAPLDITYDTAPLAARRAELGIGPRRPPILGDIVYQEIPWRKALRESVEHGRIPLWNRFVLGGEPMLANPLSAVMHPVTWIGFLLPLAQAWTFEMTLRIFLAAAAAYLFLRELGCGELPSLFGGTGWAFSEFLLFYLGWPMNTTFGVLPFVLLGLRRVVRMPSRRSVGILLSGFYLVITAGHPESSLHVVAGAGIFFLFELIAAPRDFGLRGVGLALAAGGLALGLCAPATLAFREAVPETGVYRLRHAVYAHAQRSATFPESLARSVETLLPYAHGTEFIDPGGYGGSLLFPFAALGLVSRRREKWPLLAMGLFGYFAWARFPLVSHAISRLPLFDVALNERLGALIAFSLAALAALGLERAVASPTRAPLVLASVVTAAILAVLFASRWERMGTAVAPSLRWWLFSLQIAPLLLLLLVGRGSRPALAFGTLGLLIVQRPLEAGDLYRTYSSRAFYPPIPLLDAIPRGAPDRMAALGYTFIPNISTMYEIEDVRGYEAMSLYALAETFPMWCDPQPVWFNRVDDPARPFLSFLDVRYVIAAPRQAVPAGWRMLAEDRSGRLFENPRALPRAFVPLRVFREPEPSRVRERLAEITDFGAEGVVGSATAGVVENGNGAVRVDSYGAQRLAMTVDAKERTIVATSTVGWPGWRLDIDGEERPLLSYNRAFLAFEVPAGRHRAVLRYWPRSFVTGLWISAISLFVTIALFAWPSRRPASDSARSTATGANVRAADQAIQERGSGTGSR